MKSPSLFGKIRSRSSVWITLFLSYLVILLIPVSLGAYLFRSVSSIMVKNAIQTNLDLLQQLRLAAEWRFNELNDMALKIALNPELPWVAVGGADSIDNELYSEHIVSDLQQYLEINSFVQNMFIYFPPTGTVLTSTDKLDANTFFTSWHIYRGHDLTWIMQNFFSGVKFESFFPATPVQVGQTLNDRITYVQSIPFGESERVEGYFVAEVDKNAFDDLLKPIERLSRRASVFVIGGNGKVLTSAGKQAGLASKVMTSIKGNSGYKLFQYQGSRMIMSFVVDQNGWKYVSVIPQSEVLNQVNHIEYLSLLLLLLCLIGGVVASCFLAYRNYNPILDVVNMIGNRNRRSGGPYGNGNEFDFIKQTIAGIFEEESELRENFSRQSSVVRANFLSQLIKGDVDASALGEESVKLMNVSFLHNFFWTMIIEIDECGNIEFTDGTQDSALSRFVLMNVSEELQREQAYVIEMDTNRLAILFNTAAPLQGAKQQQVSFIDELREFALRYFGIKLTIAASRFHSGAEEIGRCYHEAMAALDYRITFGPNSVILYEDIADIGRRYYRYPIENEVQLMNYAKSGDYVSAAELLDQLFEMNFKGNLIAPDMGKCLVFDLISTVLKVVTSLNAVDKEKFEQSVPDPVAHITHCKTADDMFHQTKELYRHLCGITKRERSDHGDRLYSGIMKYINENYHDSNLSLNSIADHFQITPQYLSIFFKKHGGQNLSNYIISVRIQRAKEMLIQNSLTISQIAQRIGYANDVGFVRVFKKVEGVTPGKFRDILLQSNGELSS